MSNVKIWVHAVWGTKRKYPFLVDGLRTDMLQHVVENAETKGVEICSVNCWVDHVHCLIRLDAEQCIADVIKMIKGEFSHWANQNHLTEKRFSWAREYYAGSVSKGHLSKVKNYILNQERHHSKRTFRQEVDDYFAEHPVGCQAPG
jgi:putative transposase